MRNSDSKQRLRELIDTLGIKQTDVSDRTGIGKSAISNYLNGTRVPRQDKISQIADAFKINPAWLMGYDVPMYPERTSEESLGELLRRFYNSDPGFTADLIEGLLQLTPAQLEMVNDFVQMLAAKNKDRTQAAPSTGEEME